MGSQLSKCLEGTPHSRTLSDFMFKIHSPSSCTFLRGNFRLPKLTFLKTILAIALKSSKLNWVPLLVAILRLPNIIRNLKLLPCKYNNYINWGKQTIKERQNGSEVSCSTPPTSLSLVSSCSSSHPCFFVSGSATLWTYQNLPFKVKYSEGPKRPQITYVPLRKGELPDAVKDFPKVTEGSRRFAGEFSIVIQTYHSGFSDLYQLVYMLFEGQGKHWMKLAGRKHPGGDLEKQTPSFWQEVRTRWKPPPAITVVFPKPVDGNKIQVFTQKSDEPVHDYYNWLHIVFKENSGLPSDVETTEIPLISILTNGLNQDLSLFLF